MSGPRIDPGETFLTERQREVLELRQEGLTQSEIADRFGTSIANVSSIESRARDNVARARRTVHLANDIDVAHWNRVESGTHLREVVESIYAAGDQVGVKVPYSDPELSSYLHVRLSDRLDARRLTGPIWVGLTPDGDVVTQPSGDFNFSVD